MNKISKVLFWIVFNTGMVITTFFAIHGITWALNVFNFMLWTNFICTSIVNFSKSTRKELYLEGPSVPFSIINCLDWAIILFVAAAGWFFTATILLITWGFQYNIYTNKDNAS